jgi:hypothetical protein
MSTESQRRHWRARERARLAVARRHRSEFRELMAADGDRSSTRRRARALREIARRHRAEYERDYLRLR